MKTQNNISENIKNIAYIILWKSQKIQTFKDLEYDLQISKEEIINILNLFSKAKIAYYHIVPLEENEENYDLGSIRRRMEFYTGCFKLFFNSETIKILSLEKIFYTSKENKIRKGRTNQEAQVEIDRLVNQMNNYNKSKKGQNHKASIKQVLEDLIKSEKKRNEFLKKYAKYLKLPTTQEDSEIKIGKLSINLTTGEFWYYNKKGIFNLKGKEYRVIYFLIKNLKHPSSYEEISKFINHSEAKSNRNGLYTIVRNIKREFGILPKSKKSNQDIIKNMKGFGYQLLTEN